MFCHRDLLEFDVLGEDVDYAADLQPVVDRWTSLYAATDEKHDEAEAAKLGDALVNARGIEIGHIFYFGTKYSKAMNATVTGPDGEQVFPEMGSYGIGVSRLVGGLIEAFHDENGIIWRESVAPFGAAVIDLKVGDVDCDAVCDDLYAKLRVGWCRSAL